jgi:FkbM family methyltransferase
MQTSMDGFWRQASRMRALAGSPLTRGHAKRGLSSLCKASPAASIAVEVTVAGLTAKLDLRLPADREVFLFGRADPRGIGAIEQVMARLNCRTAWDIGTNRGAHAAFMRRHCERLYGFEPNPVEFRRASDLLAADDRVTVLNLGLSDREGQLPFLIDEIDSGGSTFAIEAHEANFIAQVRTGDSLVAELGIADVDFIKIDVEGYEKNVLAGLSETIAASRPVIVIEILSSQNSELDNLKGFLPDYDIFGNETGFLSSLFMTPYSFCPFQLDKTYMCALLMPVEKRDRLRALLPH